MRYEKTIKDTDDDTARVVSYSEEGGDVEMWTRQTIGNVGVYLNFTSEQARTLARALKRAANVAEGKPAKTKPREIVDGEGDRWELNDNGTYDYEFSDGNTYYEDRSRGSIRRQFGIREERA